MDVNQIKIPNKRGSCRSARVDQSEDSVRYNLEKGLFSHVKGKRVGNRCLIQINHSRDVIQYQLNRSSSGSGSRGPTTRGRISSVSRISC